MKKLIKFLQSKKIFLLILFLLVYKYLNNHSFGLSFILLIFFCLILLIIAYSNITNNKVKSLIKNSLIFFMIFLILFQYINGDLITKNDIREVFIASIILSISLFPLILFIFMKDEVGNKIGKKIFMFLSLFLITYFFVYPLREDYFKKYVAISAFKHYIADENQSLNVKDYDFSTSKPNGDCTILYRYRVDQNDCSKDFFIVTIKKN